MKYSIHRLLALRKSTADRIEKEISGSKFIAVAQGQSQTIKGVAISAIEEDIKARYQKINDLISNYGKIKAAILRSNAGIAEGSTLKQVTVNGKSYTMAELIDASDNVYGNTKHHGFLEKLLVECRSQYIAALGSVERQKQKVDEMIHDYLTKAAANDKQLSTDDIQKRTQMFKEDGEYRLVDPLGLKKRIEDLEADILRFREECDATMSEQNATTVVDLDLTTVQ